MGTATDDLGKGVMIHLGYIPLRKYVGQTEDIRDHQLVLTIQ